MFALVNLCFKFSVSCDLFPDRHAASCLAIGGQNYPAGDEKTSCLITILHVDLNHTIRLGLNMIHAQRSSLNY